MFGEIEEDAFADHLALGGELQSGTVQNVKTGCEGEASRSEHVDAAAVDARLACEGFPNHDLDLLMHITGAIERRRHPGERIRQMRGLRCWLRVDIVTQISMSLCRGGGG